MKQNEDHFDYSELIVIIFVAILVVALWAIDKYVEEHLTEQQRIEQIQKHLKEPKFTET